MECRSRVVGDRPAGYSRADAFDSEGSIEILEFDIETVRKEDIEIGRIADSLGRTISDT